MRATWKEKEGEGREGKGTEDGEEELVQDSSRCGGELVA